MIESLVQVHQPEPAITVLTLNRPQKRNALSAALIRELDAAISVAGHEPQRRVLILAGRGKVFSAGLDLQEVSTPQAAAVSAGALAALYTTLCQCPLVTIAAAQGAAVGGGVGLLAACDLVVAGDDLQISCPEVRRGLVAALVMCLLRRQLSDRAQRQLVLLGQPLSASAAQAAGLVTQVAPVSVLLDAAMDVAHLVCQGAPGAVARSKQLLDDLAPRPMATDLRRALDYHLAARHSPEAAEGAAAFLEKRPPRWSSSAQG